MTTAASARGLSKSDLDGIRATLASGRKPKVVFTESAGQIAGQTGQVVELADPSAEEWIVVRFGRDELPFSPTDLAIPSRAPVKRAAAPKPADPPAPPLAAAYQPKPERESQPVPPQREEEPTMTSTVEPEAAPPARKAATPRQPKVKPPAQLTVTLSYIDGEWFIGAQQGAKALAKPYVIKPAEALRFVELLDVPGVHEAVEQIVEAERSTAQAHAERLRAELAEIEARIADLPNTKH